MSDNLSIEDAGVYLFMEGFKMESCAKVIRFILEKNLLPEGKRPKNLTLIINSPGGDLTACFALIDTMKSSTIPIHTVGLGQISSCGILTFMAGAKGHRVLTMNTQILSHQWSWGTGGKEHELFAVFREFELTKKRVMEHYKKCTGMPEKKIKEVLLPPEDVFLTPEEAIKYGIADSIVQTY